MKKFQLLDIKLVDFNTFELYDGAEQFENEFKQYAESRLVYKFYNDIDLEQAEKLLLRLDLQYKKFYGTEVECDDDIIGHPAFFISFTSDYNLLIEEENTFFVDRKKMGKRNFQDDTREDVLIFTKKGMEFFGKEIPEIKFEPIFDLTKKIEYYKVLSLPELDFPVIYKTALNITESEKFKNRYSIMPDGRTDLEEDAIKEIKKSKLLTCKTFKVGENTYPNAYTLFIASGEFAFKLKQNFNLKTENINMTPVYFK